MACPTCDVPMREHAEEGHGRRWDAEVASEVTMTTTTRQFKLGTREWFAVEGEAGAITFFVDSYRGRTPGDLGYHAAADEPKPVGPDGDDPFWMTDCEFTTTRGCRYSGFVSGGMLDTLNEGGPLAVFERLNAIYVKHFEEKA